MSTTTPKKPEVGDDVRVAVAHVSVPSKMMAAVLYGSEDLRIEKIDVPALAAEECCFASVWRSPMAPT